MVFKLDPNILSHHVEMQAEARPEHVVFTFENPQAGDRQISYGDLWLKANRLAAYWDESGLRAGDKVAILMRNYPEFVYALIAASINGVVVVPIDPRTRGEKLGYQLRDSGAIMAMCTGDLIERLEEVREQTGVKRLLVLNPTGPVKRSPVGDDIGEVLSSSRPLVAQRVTALNTPHQIIYTSGTTGDPKGVVLDLMRALAPKFIAQMIADVKPDDVLYTGLSLTHGNAQTVTCFPPIWLGNHAVFSERFTKTRLWDICRKYGCTTFSNLGGILTGLYSEPPLPNDADNPVRVVNSAGTPRAIWEAFEKRFDVKIREWYGTMEGGLAFKQIGEGPVGSFGKPPPGLFEMKVVRDDGSECEPNEIGELISRPGGGGAAQVDYHNNPEASKKKTEGGWLRTGDMVHRDADGWLFFDFRKGGGLRHNGDFVHPDFVERAIAEHPQISEVFVYGVEAASGAPGERDVVAAVVAFPGVQLDVASIYAKCRRDLEPNFVPSYIQVVDEIPKTISEKPQERFLAAAFSRTAANVHPDPG